MNHDVTIGDNDKYYLYITAQPSRVRHKKVGLENLKTWDQVKIDGSRSLTLMYLLLNHNIIHDDHTHNFFHDQNHLHPAIVVDKQNGGKTAQKAEKGDAVFDQNGKNGYFKNHDDVDNDQNDYLSNFKKS